jgi:hypothetical protein
MQSPFSRRPNCINPIDPPPYINIPPVTTYVDSSWCNNCDSSYCESTGFCQNSNRITNLVTSAHTLDIAILYQEYSCVEINNETYNIVELDDICIDLSVFKSIFYPYGENFGLAKEHSCDAVIYPYVSFLPPYRTIHCGQPFSLLEQIILNLENNLNVTRNCFTTSTLMELNKELSNIRTLYDINCCGLLCSLPWSNVLSIVKNDFFSRTEDNPLRTVILVISVVFKTPNSGVLPTIIKFKYRINIGNDWVL